MTDETPHKGSDLSAGLIDLGDGIRVENRLRLGTVIWLEEKLDKSISQYFDSIDLTTMRFKEFQPLIVALILQANPNMTEQEAEALSLRVDLSAVTTAMPSVMSFEAKNSPPPEVDLTEQAPATQE